MKKTLILFCLPKRGKILLLATWMNLEDFMPCEISQAPKEKIA
jgi:hypothetical protein